MGILQDDDCFKMTNEQKFSEFCKRGIGGLQACLERKALTRSEKNPEGQCLFLLNNYSSIIRYLNGKDHQFDTEVDFLELVKIQFPEVLKVFQHDLKKYKKLYLDHWTEFLKETPKAKFVKKFNEKIEKSKSFRISNKEDRAGLIEEIDGLIDGYLEDFSEKDLPKGFNYYESLNNIL